MRFKVALVCVIAAFLGTHRAATFRSRPIATGIQAATVRVGVPSRPEKPGLITEPLEATKLYALSASLDPTGLDNDD